MLDKHRYHVVSAAAVETHDEAWLSRHLPRDRSVELTNLTARLGGADDRRTAILLRSALADQRRRGLAYLPVAHAEPGTELEVELLGEGVQATVMADALYDPANERLRS